MNRYREFKRRVGNQGFTLVETMVTLTILAILMSIAAGGLAGYLRHANFKKNNEYARTIYTAAQTSFSYAKDSGQLEDLADELAAELKYEKVRTVKKENLSFLPKKDKSGTDTVLDSLKMDSSNTYYYFIFKADEEKQNYTGAKKTVYDMIAPYIYDADILKADFSIEFDAQDGKVIGVCYDDKSDGFYYSKPSDSEEKAEGANTDISYRDREDRYDSLLGYYGADSLSALAPKKTDRPIISNIKLDNGNTLDLKWKMKDNSMTTNLTYAIELFDANNSNQQVASIVLNDKRQLEVSEIVNATKNVKCSVTLYENGVPKEKAIDMAFGTYMDATGYVHLTLDAADIGSDMALNQLVAGMDYTNTYSIKRLGLSATNIYATVQTSGGGYKQSALRTSNTENTYYASQTVTGAGSADEKVVYNIKNARQLYNVRFTESEMKDKDVTYRQTGDVNWDNGTSGLVGKGEVYTSGERRKGDSVPFPTINKLNQNHTFTGKTGEQQYSIQGLHLTYHNNADEQAVDNNILPGLGLFGINDGTMESVSFESCNAGDIASEMEDKQSESYVGIACGINNGTLKEISTDADSEVQGENYVGGIAGCDASVYTLDDEFKVNKDRKLDTLTNKAKVSGSSFVGGITGSIDNSETDSQMDTAYAVKDCSNEGFVTGTNRCIGGIIGYNSGKNIVSCTSVPTLKDEADLPSPTDDLKGIYVGGIVGFNKDATVEECSAGANGDLSYVVGDKYVGGIVGLQLSGDGMTSDSVEINGNGQTNYAYVIGNKYVGGIAGANGLITDAVSISDITDLAITDEDATVVMSSAYNKDAVLESWTNKGAVAAKEQYAGGVVGYNSGQIKDGTTIVNTNRESELRNAIKEYATGNDVGGIAGENAGQIITVKENTENVNSVVVGHKNVGGLVGHETKDAVLSGYKLSGGKMSGTDNVGGMIGYNESSEFLKTTIESKPVSVDGTNNVGGVIGYNDIEVNENSSVDMEDITVNNSLGTVEASGDYAGVIIGYNKVTGTGTFTIDNAKNHTEKLASVTGKKYVGGVIGGSHDEDRLYISNFKNNTEVTATESYAGGIIGHAMKGTHISGCENHSSGEIKSNGDYLGAIAEVNNGIISDCNTNTFGKSDRKNVGGITGKNNGTVEDCKVTGVVTGGANDQEGIGGIVAYNTKDGKVYNAIVSHNVNGSGDNIGGVVGKNEGEVKGATINTSITNNGKYVGGVIGYNKGSFTHETGYDVAFGADASTVKGNTYVGGFVGKNEGGLSGLTNDGVNVVAVEGNAGGIAGVITGDDVTVEKCENKKHVTAQKSGDAGGITAKIESDVTILSCSSSGNVTANAGDAGGIVGINKGTIKGTEEKPSTVSGTITAKNSLGGVSAENEGTIKDIKVTGKIDLRASAAAGSGLKQGGITGSNYGNGIIKDCSAGSDDNKISLSVSKDGGCYGGIAGYNEGIVGNENLSKVDSTPGIKAYANISNDSVSAYMGGVVGRNQSGTVSGSEFSGTVSGNKGSSYGYGGIVGVNNGIVQYSGMRAGTVEAIGDMDDIVNVGGSVGYNETSGSIICIYMKAGTVKADTKKGVGYIGGYVGLNAGSMSGCGYESESNDTVVDSNLVEITSYYGHIGGMIGYNETKGQVNHCVNGGGKKDVWTVTAVSHSTDNGTAGVIGYNTSSRVLKDVTNYAKVTKNKNGNPKTVNALGGLIGRQENQDSGYFGLDQCKNYGTVSGTGGIDSTGAMIGRWKYKGGSLSNCVNYGKITAGGGIGGMVGDIYEPTNGETFRITGCKNYGAIEGGTGVGGMIGLTSSCSSVTNMKIKLDNCINVGTVGITNNPSNSGIFGRCDVGKNSNVIEINRCRNYGFGGNSNATKQFAGILGTRNGSGVITINDCFGVSNVQYPITSSSGATINRSYYFGKAAAGEAAFGVPVVTSSDFTISTAAAEAIEYMFDNSQDTRMSGSTKGAGATGRCTLSIALTKPVKVSKIQSTWYKTGRKYEYNMKLYDEDHTLISTTDTKTIEGTNAGGTGVKPSVDTISAGDKLVKYIDLAVNKNSGTSGNYLSIYEFTIYDENGNPYIYEKTAGDTGDKGKGTVMTVSKPGTTYKGNSSDGAVVKDLVLDPTSLGSDGLSETYYEKDDPALRAFYGFSAEKLTKPKNLDLSVDSGGYEFSWDPVDGAYAYEVEIDAYDKNGNKVDNRTMQVGGGTETFFTIPDEWREKEYTFIAKVRALSYEGKDYYSDYASTAKQNIAKFLPTPYFHYELNGSGTYDIVLEDKVIKAYKEQGIDFTKVQVVISNGGSEITYDLDKDGKISKTYGGSNGSVAVGIYAKPKASTSEYAESERTSNQTDILTFNEWKAKEHAIATFTGFAGSDFENFVYNVNLKSAGFHEIYYRAEFCKWDEKLKAWVAISTSTPRVSVSNQGGANITLKDLPGEEIASKTSGEGAYLVRAYPWASQSFVAYYSRQAESAITESQLTSNSKYYNTDGTLKDDYAIEDAGDGKYNVIYNPLNVMTDCQKQILTQDFSGTNTWPASLDKSKITINNPTVENGEYTFSWDDTNSGTGVYKVVITGTTESGDEVEVYSGTVQRSQTDPIDGSAWRYTNLNVAVTRLSTENSSGVITTFPAKQEKDFPQKLHLSTVEKPSVTLTNEDGEYDKLEYTIRWPRVEEDTKEDVTKNEKMDSYIVYGSYKDDSNATKKIVLATYNGSEAVGASRSAVVDFEKAGPENVDLSGKEVAITIVAKAKASETHYQDSAANDPYNLNVQSRKTAPSLGKLTLDKVYEATSSISESSFTKDGFKLAYKDSEAVGAGGYQIKASIYSDENCENKLYDYNNNDKVNMNGTLQDSSVTLKDIPWESYAACWLKVSIRSVNSGEICSTWDTKTFRLPITQLNVPGLSDDDTTSENYGYIDPDDTSKVTGSVDLNQDTVSWDLAEKVAMYHIQTKTLTDDESEYELYFDRSVNLDADKNNNPITLKKKEREKNEQTGEMETVWKPISLDTKKTKTETDPKELKDETLSYTQTKTYVYDSGNVNTVSTTYEGKTYYINITGYIQIVETRSFTRKDKNDSWKEDVDKRTYRFDVVMPDVTAASSIDKLGDTERRYTKEVSVTANPKDVSVDEVPVFATSKYRVWQRVKASDGSWKTEIKTKTKLDE